ncbi:MAG: AAA family ATPase [Thermoplasmata archaeon]|nr:AAA family ATPase [Thermoplasmata archaeon]
MFKRVVLDNFLSFAHLDLDLSETKSKPSRYALIYGDNGSGKTGIVKAFHFLRQSVRTLGENSYGEMTEGTLTFFDRSQYISVRPMPNSVDLASSPDLFDFPNLQTDVTVLSNRHCMIGSSGNIRAEYVFSLNGKDADYVMEFGSDGRIVRETLDYCINGRKALLYDLDYRVSRDDETEVLDRTRNRRFNRSFFGSDAYRSETDELLSKYWGRHTFLSILRSERQKSNPEYMEGAVCAEVMEVLDYIRDMTLGLGGNWGLFSLFNPENGTLPASQRNRLDAYECAISEFFSRITDDIRGAHYLVSESNGRLNYTLVFERRVHGEYRDVRAVDESLGVRRLLNLLPYLIRLYKGGVVIMDEMDAGIHDMRMSGLLNEIGGYERGQLIMTTHNTYLMCDANPRYVHIINVDGNGDRSVVTVGSEVRTQKNNNNEARYRRGLFGGLPTTDKVDMGSIVEDFDRITEGGKRN